MTLILCNFPMDNNKFRPWENSENDVFWLRVACVNGAILVILFKKIGYFFLKIHKKLKTIKKIILKIMNIILSTYTLIYVSPKNIIFLEIFLKFFFFQISVKFQNSSGTTVTVTLAVTVKTFSLENVAKMK